MGGDLFASELIIYLLAIAGLLGLWLFHQMQVRSGRIQAVDLFDRSMVRLYLYATPDGFPFCEVCAQAQGSAFLSSRVGKKGFSPLEGACSHAGRCQGCLIGLYGGWLEARALVARLETLPKKTRARLSRAELGSLVKGEWDKSVSADTDRVSIHMLEGLCHEKSDVHAAVAGYRYVIDHAKDTRHLSLVVPATLRLLAVLGRIGREKEASQVVEEFERRFPIDYTGCHGPSADQRRILEEEKALLWKRLSLKVSA